MTLTRAELAFRSEPDFEDGIYRALSKRPRLGLAQASNFWPVTAKLYEPLWRKRSLSLLTAGSFTVERELALMLSWLAPKANERILDLACSAGLYARTLLKHEPSLKLDALDFSLPFLQTAKAYAQRDGLAMTLVQADVHDLPYQNGVFDALVCGGSLNEFSDLPLVLAEMARVLKPGGRIWVMYLKPSQALLGRALQAFIRLSGIRFIVPETLERNAELKGLTLLKAQHRGVVVMAIFEKPALEP